jgi:cell division protein FtsW (lipid II flippase)
MPLQAAVPNLRRPSLAFSASSVIETLLVILVIAWLLPAFARLAEAGGARDERFARLGLSVRGLPDASLPAVCAAHGALAEAAVRERLCAKLRTPQALPVSAMPAVLTNALAQARAGFAQPVLDAQAQLQRLQQQQRDGQGGVRALADDVAAVESDLTPFVTRFQLGDGETHAPAPLACASQLVAAALDEPMSNDTDTSAQLARANAVLLLAAAIDGHGATQALANAAVLPSVRITSSPSCNERLPEALSDAAAVMADARLSTLNTRKNEAVQALWPHAGLQWAAAMLLGLVFVKASRSRMRPALGVAFALAAWAAAAWAARVPSPFSASRVFDPGRAELAPWSQPSTLVLAMAGSALLLLAWCAVRKRPSAPRAQTLSTRLGYPGLVAATGIGWLLLLDLSAHGHFGNRYLALYHQGHLWLAMTVFSAMLFLRQPLANGMAWTFSVVGETAGGATRRLGSLTAFGVLVLAAAALAAGIGVPLSNMRQFTSELGRVWVIVGAAWFFFLRGGPLAERIAQSGAPAGSMLRYIAPLLFVALVLLGLMLVTHDMGPLLIAGYGAGAFIAASIAMWWTQRGGSAWFAFMLAVLLFAAWIAGTTAALFKLGAIDPLTATRLESLAAPLASTNDQLALVQWFQRAAPADGFGPGTVPWCGHAPAGGCTGVPAQIHSDYTFTAIVGVFGPMAAWTASLACALWLHRLIRHHARVTSGDPRFVTSSGRSTVDSQGLLSWISVGWVVLTLCQLAVTVAGNMAVLPLTGVTFPFVSFGMTSLVVNMAFLALCINVSLPDGSPDDGARDGRSRDD